MKSFFCVLFALFLGFLSLSVSFANEFGGGSITTVNTEHLQSDSTAPGQNDLTNALCTLILMLNGRVARVMAAVAIFAVGIMFFMGKITWPVLTTIGVAMGLVFGAKTVAIIMLPRAVYVYDERDEDMNIKTSSEIITQACPELK